MMNSHVSRHKSDRRLYCHHVVTTQLAEPRSVTHGGDCISNKNILLAVNAIQDVAITFLKHIISIDSTLEKGADPGKNLLVIYWKYFIVPIFIAIVHNTAIFIAILLVLTIFIAIIYYLLYVQISSMYLLHTYKRSTIYLKYP